MTETDELIRLLQFIVLAFPGVAIVLELLYDLPEDDDPVSDGVSFVTMFIFLFLTVIGLFTAAELFGEVDSTKMKIVASLIFISFALFYYIPYKAYQLQIRERKLSDSNQSEGKRDILVVSIRIG